MNYYTAPASNMSYHLKSKRRGAKGDPKEVLKVISEYTGVAEEKIIGRGKKANIPYARHLAMYMIRWKTNLSYKEIGKLFDQCHHTSVIYGVEKIENLADVYDEVRNDILNLSAKFLN